MKKTFKIANESEKTIVGLQNLTRGLWRIFSGGSPIFIVGDTAPRWNETTKQWNDVIYVAPDENSIPENAILESYDSSEFVRCPKGTSISFTQD